MEKNRKTYLTEFLDKLDQNIAERLFRDYDLIMKPASYSNPVTIAMFRGFRLNESLTRTYPINKTISYVKKYFDLEDGQIIKKKAENDIEFICVFMPNIRENVSLMVKAMAYCGYFLGYPKNPATLSKNEIVELQFEPRFQNDITKELHEKERVLYHLTPRYNLGKIRHIGFSPRSKNELFNFPDRVYFLRGSIGEENIVNLGEELNDNNNSLGNNGKYLLFMLDLLEIPKRVKFFADPNYYYGVYTMNNISPDAIINIRELNYLK